MEIASLRSPFSTFEQLLRLLSRCSQDRPPFCLGLNLRERNAHHSSTGLRHVAKGPSEEPSAPQVKHRGRTVLPLESASGFTVPRMARPRNGHHESRTQSSQISDVSELLAVLLAYLLSLHPVSFLLLPWSRSPQPQPFQILRIGDAVGVSGALSSLQS